MIYENKFVFEKDITEYMGEINRIAVKCNRNGSGWLISIHALDISEPDISPD